MPILMIFFPHLIPTWDFPGGSEVKASACNAGDLGLIPGLGRSPGEGNGNPLQFLAWRIPWMEEPGGLQSMGLQRVGHDWVTSLSLSEEKNCSHLDLCFFWDHSMSLLSSFFSSWWTGEKSECWVIWRNSVKFVFCCFFLDVCRFICCLKKTYNTS